MTVCDTIDWSYITHGGTPYVKLGVWHTFMKNAIHSRFNVSLHIPATDEVEYQAYGEVTDWEFVRHGQPTQLLSNILDRLETEYVEKRIVDSISVGALSIFICLDERKTDNSDLIALQEMIDDQLAHLIDK